MRKPVSATMSASWELGSTGPYPDRRGTISAGAGKSRPPRKRSADRRPVMSEDQNVAVVTGALAGLGAASQSLARSGDLFETRPCEVRHEQYPDTWRDR